MKKKLIILLIPITISVVGMIYLQIDWLTKTAQTENAKRSTNADIALRLALDKIYRRQNDSVKRALTPLLTPLADSVKFIFSANGDSLSIAFADKKIGTMSPTKPGSYSIGYDLGRVRISEPKRPMFLDKKSEEYKRVQAKDSIMERTARHVFSIESRVHDSIYFRTDSVKILQNVKHELIAMGEPAMAQTTCLSLASGQRTPAPINKPFSTNFKEYLPQGINAFNGSKKWVAIWLQPGLINTKLLVFTLISCVLTLMLICAIAYLFKLILKQKQLADMKDDFINNLTHEFKTPIATVSAAVEGLQKFNALDDKAKTTRYLEISRTELNRLNDMVTKVLNISSYEKKTLDLEPETIDLEAMIVEVTNTETFRAVKPLKFSVNIAPGIKQITADPLHFKNVLTNLVDNSVKYSKESVEIGITAYADNGMVYIKIQDNGIGIPASALKFVFDKFYRVTNGNLYNVKGNGLGLSYVKFVIEAHGGTISLKSEINIGTEFLIAIPLK